MPITLAESKVGMRDKVAQTVVDEFRRSSFLLDQLVFDNAVSPATGGSTLVYGYTKLMTPSTASFRALNSEYSTNEAKRKEATAKLAIFGGAFSLDRVIIETAGAVDELDFQVKQKIEAARNLFHWALINGDNTKDNQFDGLAKMLKGTSTEIAATGIDLSTTQKMTDNADAFLDTLDAFMANLAGKPTMLLMNSVMLTKIKGIARRKGYYSRVEDAFGRPVDCWDNIPMLDLGKFYDDAKNKTVDCIEIAELAGTTSIYAVTLGLDALHGVTPRGDKIISTNLPDLTQPGAIKTGDVEMVAAIALKNSLKAGVLTGIKVK